MIEDQLHQLLNCRVQLGDDGLAAACVGSLWSLRSFTASLVRLVFVGSLNEGILVELGTFVSVIPRKSSLVLELAPEMTERYCEPPISQKFALAGLSNCERSALSRTSKGTYFYPTASTSGTFLHR